MPRAVKNTPASGPSFGAYVKAGFGVGLGTAAVIIILTLLAVAFFIPGFIIVRRQFKLPKEERSTGMIVLGFILMGIGMIVGLGFGIGIFFDSLGDFV